MSVLVVCNPVCGDSTAEQLLDAHVLPRLHAANRVPTEVARTRAPGHAGQLVLDFFRRQGGGDLVVVLASGDGTLQEIVDCLASAADLSFSIRFALVPCGTANALYASLFKPSPLHDAVAYKLQSLEAFLGSATPRPLSLSLTSLLGPHGPHHGHGDPRPVASVVVTSTALHAAILKDSEKLRSQIPGIDRFKVAAQQNITKWYASRVRLLPSPSSGLVHSYDPLVGDFVPTARSNESNGPLDVHGPFAYFLSTVNVDRLEPEFRINPTISSIPSKDPSMDVVIVRPQRDPTFTLDTPQARERFAAKVYAVLTAAYQDGKHINLRYSETGDIVESGEGNTVVECFRCGSWEWIPDKTDEDAHLLCADGAIFHIEKGGRAICRAARGDTAPQNFSVHV